MMEGSPQRKKARFSEHPQVFEYSSKSKKQNQGDNDSLLLDMNDEQPRHIASTSKVSEKDQMDDIASQQQLQIEELTSDLAQIEAYLQQQSKPIQEPAKQMPYTISDLTPLKQVNPSRSSDRFSINFKPELRNGRDTMNLEQEIRVRSTVKQLDNDISNNKKRAMREEKNRDMAIEEKIGEQLKKNKRITMDVKELLNMIDEYKTGDEEKKARYERKNRITMDVFALSKLLENVEEQTDGDENKTPSKILDREIRKNKVFSAFKQSPHSAEVKLFVNSYLNEAPKRLQEKQAENKKAMEYISELKSELLKMDLKISDAKKRAQKRTAEKAHLQRKLKAVNEELNKKKYLEDLEAIVKIEEKIEMNVLKCDVQEDSCYGHFIFDGIFLKIKSRSKNGPSDIKLMISQEAREKEKYFLISVEDSLRLVKKYHLKLQEKGQPFFQNILKIRKAYSRIKKFDSELYYLSLDFELKEFELNPGLDRLSFQICLGGDRLLLVQINMTSFLTDQLDNKAVAFYDPSKPGYLEIQIEVKPMQSVLFEKVKKIIQLGII